VFLQYFDTVGWVLRPIKNRRPYNLYCVGGDVKPCSINAEGQKGLQVAANKFTVCKQGKGFGEERCGWATKSLNTAWHTLQQITVVPQSELVIILYHGDVYDDVKVTSIDGTIVPD